MCIQSVLPDSRLTLFSLPLGSFNTPTCSIRFQVVTESDVFPPQHLKNPLTLRSLPQLITLDCPYRAYTSFAPDSYCIAAFCLAGQFGGATDHLKTCNSLNMNPDW